MIIWNISLRNDVDDLEQRIAAIQGENTTLRESANATVYQLLPTEDAPSNAHAQAWFSIQGSGVLSVANLPQLEAGTTYQFWYITDSPTNPVPGGTFTVDSNGQGFMLIPADVSGVTSIAISIEPEGGSASPTGTILLTSDVSDARG
jgi:anti-sigma-K factor RskA